MNILFVTSGSIGDAIISSGILAYLANAYPQARFTIAGGAAAVSVFEAFPQLERIIKVHKKPYNAHWLELWLQVKGKHWDIVVDLRGSLLAYLVHTKRRYIFRKGNPAKSKSEQLAALIGLDVPPPTRLWSSSQAKAAAAALLPPGKEIIVIAPKTNSEAKDWPIERFAELARRLYAQDRVCAVLASDAQRVSVQPLIEAVQGDYMLDLCGRTDLLTAYAVMEQGRLFIGNDSGLLHMAAAAGIDCVGIYGPSNDKTYAPSGNHVRIVKSYDFMPGEKEKRDNRYMQMISVDMVEKALPTSYAREAG